MQVHQMISTVTSKLDPQYGVVALRTTFLWKHDWSAKDFSDENN
jgi:hypothetical protein